jgi:hypothetical protein
VLVAYYQFIEDGESLMRELGVEIDVYTADHDLDIRKLRLDILRQLCAGGYGGAESGKGYFFGQTLCGTERFLKHIIMKIMHFDSVFVHYGSKAEKTCTEDAGFGRCGRSYFVVSHVVLKTKILLFTFRKSWIYIPLIVSIIY